MPRKQVEACMICAPDPCECFTKPKTTAKRPKRPVEEPVPLVRKEVEGDLSPSPRQDLRAKMKAAAAKAPPTPVPVQQPARRTPVMPVLTDEQLLEQAALRALLPIMHPEDRQKYSMIVQETPSLSRRKAEWKARRRHDLSSST